MPCYICSHCNKCGMYSIKMDVSCASCGEPILPGRNSCPKCGTKYSNNMYLPPIKKREGAADFYDAEKEVHP